MSYLVDPFSSNDFKNLLGGSTSVTNAQGATGPAGGEIFQVVRAVGPDTRAIRKGVYADFPASTPKYSTANDDKSLQTQARLLIPFPNDTTYKKYLSSFMGYGSDVNSLAKALAAPAGGARTNRPNGYIDFLLTQAQEGFEEKMQLVDVVGDNYVAYFFGQRPPIFSYQGVLMNTKQDDWRLAMLLIYQNIIRGTQLARRNTMVTLAYDKLAVTGALVNMTQVLTAEMQMAAQFNFQILVKRLDVQRTEGAPATVLGALPYAVRPDTFATTVFDMPKISMRQVWTPADATVSRKEEAPPPVSTLMTTEVPKVYGAVEAAKSSLFALSVVQLASKQ